MNNAIAKIISYVFHPVFMPTIGVLILGHYINPYQIFNYKFILLSTFIFTCLFPILIVSLMKFIGLIDKLTIDERQSRIYPFLATSILYVFNCYSLFTKVGLNIPFVLVVFLLGTTLASILLFIINLKWKISAHAIGIGGILSILFLVSVHYNIVLHNELILSILVAGIVGVARLSLNAHSLLQVNSGYILGTLSVVSFYYYFLLL